MALTHLFESRQTAFAGLRWRLSILSAIVAKSRDWLYGTSVRIAAKRAAQARSTSYSGRIIHLRDCVDFREFSFAAGNPLR